MGEPRYTTVRAGRRRVRISNPGKVLFPPDGTAEGPSGDSADGVTKADLAAYYRQVARRMLPHLRGRPLMLERHPGGIEDRGFMQKDTPGYVPDWVRRVELPKEGGSVTYTVCDDTATLVYLAGQGCVTPHRFLSRVDGPGGTGESPGPAETARRPDRLVFDLDPPDSDFGPVRSAAGRVGALLAELELPSTVMTTGSRGLHVVVPLDARADVDEVRAFARDAADLLAARYPEELTAEARKAARRGRLYLDVQRNAYGQTSVAPYSVRSLPGAPAAAPVTWDDVADPELTARRWTLGTVAGLLASDPWRGAPRGRALGPARRRLDALRDGG